MKILRSLLASALLLSLGFAGCDSGGDDDKQAATGDAPSKDDVVQVTDLLVAESQGSGALHVGDAAELLLAARKESLDAVARLRAVLERLQDVAQNTAPGRTGTTPAGLPYAVWTGAREGIDLKFVATRINPDRVSYLLFGKKSSDAVYKRLLNGIFIKKAPSKGGGRLHLDLSAISDLGGAQADGMAYLWWANVHEGIVARRVVYRGVTDREGAYKEPRNYGMDYLHKEGDGGRFRTIVAGDLTAKNPGNEALGVRVLWKSAEGGRADAVLLALKPPKLLGHASECWDKNGARSAYENDIADDDADNPNEGDVTSCWGYDRDKLPDTPSLDSSDTDPEVDAALNEVGATAITEDEANAVTSPE